jgi:uncharacterized repeat protein (TIGR03803 family)
MSKLNLLGKVALVCAFCALAPGATFAYTFTSLFSFNGSNGRSPYGALVQGFNGNLYGVTPYGGGYGWGTVFEFTRAGKLKTLYSFCTETNSQRDCLDGATPSGLVQGTDGNLYGTTGEGGANFNNINLVGGTVFKITPAGELTTLYSFCSQTTKGVCTDGADPAGLVQAADGNFYGITVTAGAPGCSGEISPGCGTVFKITPTGKLTTLHTFTGPDGRTPYGKLVQGTDGNLYGTTAEGGAYDKGTVFKITPAGELTTLYSFCSQPNCLDGVTSYEGLVQGADGDFYGTTVFGGAYDMGTVFEITPAGELTTLHSFQHVRGPDADLVLTPGGNIAANGSLWGTTGGGGSHAGGTLFGLYLGGKFITRYNFCSEANCGDGRYPTGVMQATNGKFYGVTLGEGDGTIYSFDVGFGPFVETLPTSSTVGTTVIILGNNLTGTTSVTFNGTPATFTVVSNTEITTTVPSGATTGEVQVATPTRTLTSNVNFQVN